MTSKSKPYTRPPFAKSKVDSVGFSPDDQLEWVVARAEEAHENLVRLKNEEREINFKVGELKRRFAKVRQEPEFSVNAGALLDQLEGIVGADHGTKDAIAEAEAEVALEALKRKMEAESDD